MRILMALASGRFTGGRLAIIRHAVALHQRGHQVTVAIQDDASSLAEWADPKPPLITFRAVDELPAADVCLFDRVRLARPLFENRPEPVVHFCQGFERTDLENRLTELQHSSGGWFTKLLKRNEHRRKLREIDEAYRLPTIKFVTHRHLGDSIRRYYGQFSSLIPYGLPEGTFAPGDSRLIRPETILAVGPMSTGWKRVEDALQTVALLKKKRPGLRLIRVAQEPMTEPEMRMGVTDIYLTMLTPSRMAEIYREAHLLLLTSDATEGFGLPALEAMACGLPCVLTHIPAFRTFAPIADYACFIPVGQPEVAADRVAQLLDDQAARQLLRQRGLQVSSGYSWRRSIDTMEFNLARCCNGPVRLVA